MTKSSDPTLGLAFTIEVKRANDQKSVDVNPHTWTKYATMNDLGNLPVSITRADLRKDRRLAGDLADDDALRLLFVKTIMWGSGKSNGRGPRNCHAALDSNPLPVLRESARLVDDGDLDAAYLLHRGIPGLGPAFFTKWLWAVGSNSKKRPTPLILDSLVWRALGHLGWDSREAAGSRSWGDRYVAYLEACEVWAKANGVEPEDIEYSLFAWKPEQ